MRDTSPQIEQKMREMIQLKTPQERLEMGCSMYEISKQLVINSILQDNPTISKQALRVEFFLKFYGNDFDPEQKEKIINHLNQLP